MTLHEDPTAGLTFAEIVARNVRNYRGAAELTQAQLAEKSHVALRTVCEIENAKRSTPKGDTLDRLARALGVAPRDLVVVSAATCEVCGATCATCASRILSTRLQAAAYGAP